jgi:hypothetical protein
MILAMDTATEAHISYRWIAGLSVMLFSLVVMAENTARLEISPSYDEGRQTTEIYNSAGGWRTPPASESEWRPEAQQQESRIQFGYDSAYEEMRARSNDNSLGTDFGLTGQPKNTQFKIGF